MSEHTEAFMKFRELQRDTPPSYRGVEKIDPERGTKISKKIDEARLELAKHNAFKAETLAGMTLDVATERAPKELHDMEFKDLLGAAIKLRPTLVETTVNNTFTFADMVAKATIELEKINELDVSEGVTVESSRHSEDVSD